MSSEIGRFPDDRLFLSQRVTAIFADDNETGRNPDAHPDQHVVFGVGRPDGANDAQCCPHGSFGIVFVGTRIPEQCHNAVADVVGDNTIELADRVATASVVLARYY
jgi:hypothetical protein